MECEPITIDIPLQSATLVPFIVQGDTIDPYTIEAPEFPDLTTAVSIKLQLYYGTQKVADWSVGNGITVDSATKCTIDRVAKEDNNLPEGKLMGDFEVTDVNGIRKTYFRFRYTIKRQYSK